MSPLTTPPPQGPLPRRPSAAQLSHPDIAAFLRRPAAFLARAALVTVNLAAVTFFLLSYTRTGVSFGPYHIDLDVYRIGARVWQHGGNLYGPLPATRAGVRLPFTYPPFAAILLAPLALVPFLAAATALTLATVALLAIVLRVFLRRLAGPAAGSPWALAWLLPPALFLEPVRDTLAFGQVNVVLMALVSLDCLAEAPRWPRGALTGLAAAVKLTPAAFALFFLLRRDYRAAAGAGLSFAAATAVGFAAAWHDSVHYWTRTLPQGGRAGSPASASNQCILAVLARAGLDPHSAAGVAAWLALATVVVIVASRGMRHALAASQDCLALSLNGFTALLISPVSWSHHWVWCGPVLLTIATLGSRRHHSRLALVAATSGLVVFAAAPQFWFPRGLQRETHWAAWQQATASTYVLFAALILLLASSALTRRRLTNNSQNLPAAQPTDTRQRSYHPHQPQGLPDLPPVGSVPAGQGAPDARSRPDPLTPRRSLNKPRLSSSGIRDSIGARSNILRSIADAIARFASRVVPSLRIRAR